MNQTPAHLNPSLPLEDRIDALLKAMTVEEKCTQLRHESPPIERLQVPGYNWWNEALHGVARNGKATVFPQAIGLAATWDAELVREIATIISDEARAKHHAAVRRGSRQQYQGLTFWTPNINIFRDPRWGRGQETWGEDPGLTGTMGTAFVRGLQGDDPRYLKTAACAKHYAVHSGPEGLRHEFDVHPSKLDLEEIYLPAFQTLVEAGVEAVMPAYNAVYGEPCAGSLFLLEETLRQRWGFKGHVVSDCWAIRDFHTSHKVTDSAEASAAKALKAGCDLNCGSVYCESLLDAVKMKLCTEEDVDRALRRLLRCRFRLGQFDPEETVPFASIPEDIVHCQTHREKAAEAARRSIVLLKNLNQALPIDPATDYLMLLGPLATDVDAMLGNYHGLSPRVTTLLEGVADAVPPTMRLDYRHGCLRSQPIRNKRDWSGFEAANSDVAIIALGLNPTMEGEEGDAIDAEEYGDRTDIELPESQLRFFERTMNTIRERGSKTRVIVVLFSGSAVAIPEIAEQADAILQVWYPGEAGGEAIADVLFGKCNPSGRLPVTVHRSTADLPGFDDYAIEGHTYRYSDPGKVLFPFGFGLSYTTFSYQWETEKNTPSLQSHIDGDLEIRIKVTNEGTWAGHEVVQCYLRDRRPRPRTPAFELAAFTTVHLEPGESKSVQLSLPAKAFSLIDEDGCRRDEPGQLDLFVGGSLPDQRSAELGAAPPLQTTVERLS